MRRAILLVVLLGCFVGIGWADAKTDTTESAWKSLGAKRFNEVHEAAKVCLDMWAEEARAQQWQIQLSGTTIINPSTYQALNTVGECAYLDAAAYEGEGRYVEAIKAYERIPHEFSHSYFFIDNHPTQISIMADERIKQLNKLIEDSHE